MLRYKYITFIFANQYNAKKISDFCSENHNFVPNMYIKIKNDINFALIIPFVFLHTENRHAIIIIAKTKGADSHE